jgi:hypothetical protein
VKKERKKMRYYIYDAEAGYEEFEDLKEAAKKFLETDYKSGYLAFGLTEGAASVDIIFKQIEDDEVILKGSADFLSSSLLNKKPKEFIDSMIMAYRALNHPEYHLVNIIANNQEEQLQKEVMEME